MQRNNVYFISLSYIYLNSPYEFPNKLYNYYQLNYDIDNYVSVTLGFNMIPIVSSPSIKELSVSQRKCQFRTERKLIVSPSYSKGACELQCRYQEIMDICKCSPLIFFNLGTYGFHLIPCIYIIMFYVSAYAIFANFLSDWQIYKVLHQFLKVWNFG